MLKGTTRCVYLVGKYAIKTPSIQSWEQFLQGMLANLQERCWWKETHHKNLARVYYCDCFGLCLIMERANYVICNNPNEFTQKIVAEFFHDCTEAGLPVDPRPSNIGVFDEQYKLIDYGS